MMPMQYRGDSMEETTAIPHGMMEKIDPGQNAVCQHQGKRRHVKGAALMPNLALSARGLLQRPRSSVGLGASSF